MRISCDPRKCFRAALPGIVKRLNNHQVEIRGDEKARAVCTEILPASEEDWGMEYLDAIISVKTVASLDEAIRHINRYNTGHSEAIITKDYDSALRFQDEIDAAAVVMSMRPPDLQMEFEFGFWRGNRDQYAESCMQEDRWD